MGRDMPQKDEHDATTSWLSIGDAVKRYTDKCADAIERGQLEIAESYHRESVSAVRPKNGGEQ